VDENGEIFELEKVVPLSDPDLIDFEHTHFLKGIKKSWTGTEKDFLKVFSKVE
jgi:hypothetical protein